MKLWLVVIKRIDGLTEVSAHWNLDMAILVAKKITNKRHKPGEDMFFVGICRTNEKDEIVEDIVFKKKW